MDALRGWNWKVQIVGHSLFAKPDSTKASLGMEGADNGPLFAEADSTKASLDMVRIRLPNPSPPRQGSNNTV